VATLPSTHVLYAIGALKAGKPVYVEKPMAMNYTECNSMIKAVEQYGQKLWVAAYYWRDFPYFIKIKELFDSGTIGRLQIVGVRYSKQLASSDLSLDMRT
jgi:predicted dehydrogenase